MSAGLLEGERHLFKKGERGYPQPLYDLESPPPEIFVLGNPQALDRPFASIIGARKATPYGLECARLTARTCVEFGLAVVSGAAIGCDQAAQRETLAHGGETVAVLGTGADVVYPEDARDMLAEILRRNGAIVALRPWGAAPTRWSFVQRNAVIAALSGMLVICEAGMPSGTFSTAECAESLGRDVLVYPGPFFSENSRGSNYLLAQCPTVVPIYDKECIETAITRVFGLLRAKWTERGKPIPEDDLDPMQQEALRCLEACPMRVEELGRGLGLDVVETARMLSDLELRGIVERLMDGRHSLSGAALRARIERGSPSGKG